MASVPSTSVSEFSKVLESSSRILALCGAGLSAASGLDTFRGAGGMWRNYQATTLATPGAFKTDPGLVWLFYSMRRHKALQAKPNPGHYALAELARKRPGFITLTQNVDGEWILHLGERMIKWLLLPLASGLSSPHFEHHIACCFDPS